MDWLFTNENGICHVRVAGLLLKEGRLFVQKAIGQEEYALPGGHLQFGETTEQALLREFQEEFGVRIRCRRLLWTEETFWKWDGKNAHAIGFYYLIDLCEGAVLPAEFAPLKDHRRVAAGWAPIGELDNLPIYPPFLKKEIQNLAEHPKHFVRRG
ncbi:MAG TPA: NUDIX domain-containing protein [Firmicutes bacterium]|nr:NUDIX domain-containing protein [Bacillota bacterium]